ncbi:hypothetical protein PAI11_21890 [Patulibacter medicamentivorans]|uniref:Uncharacterized protein n=1 Tax=Patulibacter medicamentivorans TaxID=1097667 RepID=H0E5U0_9ACTN|nr:hypothetical protein PAI11_21890 [Patulibacter medicamentivorans]
MPVAARSGAAPRPPATVAPRHRVRRSPPSRAAGMAGWRSWPPMRPTRISRRS